MEADQVYGEGPNHTAARSANINLAPKTSLPTSRHGTKSKETPMGVFVEGRTEPPKDGRGSALSIWRS